MTANLNANLTTLDTGPATAKSVLAKNGYQCSLITLAPGDETPRREARDFEEHILFVIEGEATVQHDDVNTILTRDHALLIPKDQGYQIVGSTTGAKVLQIDIPQSQAITSPLITVVG